MTADLATRLRDVERHIARLVDTGVLPHAQFLAARGEEVLHAFHIGQARDDGRPLRSDALYRIASMTKMVTAVLFMMLVEEGRAALDDRLADHLPELSGLRAYAGGSQPPFETRTATRQPRLRDLLRHTAGFTYGFFPDSPVDQAYWRAGIHNFKATLRRRTVLADLAALPLLFDPGSHFAYGFSTDLIGMICERLMGDRLGELFRRRIFEPLGMVDTGFFVPPDQIDRLTDCWADHPRRGRYIYDAAEGGIWSRQPIYESGGGGLASSITDYHRFCRAMLAGGESLLRPGTVVEMVRNHLPGGSDMAAISLPGTMFADARYACDGHGLGMAVTLAGSAVPEGEFHWSGLFSSWFSVVPSEGIVLIFMTQQLSVEDPPLACEVKRMLFAR